MIDALGLMDLSDEDLETLMPEVDDDFLKTINLDNYLVVEVVGDILIQLYRWKNDRDQSN